MSLSKLGLQPEVIHTKHRKLCSKPGFCLVDIGQKVLQGTGARIQMATACTDTCTNQVEDTEHILVNCDAYIECKKNLYSLANKKGYLLQFIVDCSTLPSVILAVQNHGNYILEELFYLTRTWCFSVHRERMRRLGRWNYQ